MIKTKTVFFRLLAVMLAVFTAQNLHIVITDSSYIVFA